MLSLRLMSIPDVESEAATADHRRRYGFRAREPRALVPVWWLLGLLVLAEALHEIFGVGSPNAVFGLGIQGFLLVAATILCLARGVFGHNGRPWLWIGAGLGCWAVGTVAWDVFYSSDPNPPYPSFADVLWLAWYPLIGWGMLQLINERVERFELHRWMDGLAVMLVVITPAVALIVQPVAEHTTDDGLAAVVDFSYPILDVLMVGGVLGVCGLLGWRPGRTWVLLGIGCVLIALADGVFSVQQARGGLIGGDYDFLWSGGALLVAAAAWASAPGEGTDVEVYGWRAILLPVAAQLCAAGIQVYALFFSIGRSERLVTLIVLVVATVQVVISRPRPPSQDTP
jgi:hypothetical protein